MEFLGLLPGGGLLHLIFIVHLILFRSCSSVEVRDINLSLIENVEPDYVVGNIIEEAGIPYELRRHDIKGVQIELLPEARGYNKLFLIENTGVLLTKVSIDRDSFCPGLDTCVLTIHVKVKTTDIYIVKVHITVVDTNDIAPSFEDSSIILTVSEAALPGLQLALPGGQDRDSPSNGIDRYELVQTNNAFSLKTIGEDVRLVLVKKLDRETKTSYDLQLIARDGGSPPKSGSLNITITVLDVNDNLPKFNRSKYEATVSENWPEGATVLRVHAHDGDIDENGRVSYALSRRSKQLFGNCFNIEPDTGVITLKRKLDYEQKRKYQLSVVAFDHGSTPLTDLATVIVYVNDVNDEYPQISITTLAAGNNNRAIEIPENSPSGIFVSHLTVTDGDKGQTGDVICQVQQRGFALVRFKKNEYQIKTATTFDRERSATLNLTITCADFGTPSLTSTRPLPIRITDVNDNAPVFKNLPYYATLSENKPIGGVILSVTAADADIGLNGTVRYKLDKAVYDSFEIQQNTGLIIANSIFDYEQQPFIKFLVIATDEGSPPRSSSATVTVQIRDENDAAPRFSQQKYNFDVSENLEGGVKVGSVSAIDADASPYNQITYSLDRFGPSGDDFSIDPFSGLIRTKKRLNREQKQQHHFTVKASDSGKPSKSSNVTVTVKVSDKNDIDPIIDFPNPHNKSVKVSVNIPVGYKITEVKAHDDDLGKNAKLEYFISEELTKNKFGIDKSTGVVTLRSSFEQFDEHPIFSGLVTVRDCGDVPRSATASLVIIFDRTVPYVRPKMPEPAAPAQERPVLSRRNFLILVITASASGLLIIALISVLIYMRRTANPTSAPFKYYSSVATHVPFLGNLSSSAALKRKQCEPKPPPATKPDGSMLRKSRDNFMVVLEHSTSPQSTIYRREVSM